MRFLPQNISHNQLTQVHKLNFDNLEKLDLSHNRITSAKLKKLPKNVIHLNLAHNEISYLPLDFMKLKELRSLELDGNPLNCTCNTLLVRDWLSYRHIWSDNRILCTSPAHVKGQPWLQARKNDICLEVSSTTQQSKYNWDNYEDDNEIMMADQPQADDATDLDYEEEEEDAPAEKNDESPAEKDDMPAADEASEDDKAEDVFADPSEKPQSDEDEKPSEDDDDLENFMPVSQEPDHVSKHVTDLQENYDEGSGGGVVETSEQPEEDGESGSGYIIPHKDELESSTADDENSSVGGLGIFEDDTEAPIGVHRESLPGAAVESEPIDVSAQSGDVKKASTDDNTGTYILLGILALCLISLMVFVAMKNRQEKNRNRRYDVERNGATELQDMDKRLLGKPVDKNGNGNGTAEQKPLINDFTHKEEAPKAYTSFQPPSINIDEPKASPRDKEKSQQSLYENVPKGNGHEPVHKTPTNGEVPRSPDSDDEAFHPATYASPGSLNVSPEPPKRYSPIYNPASPRSDRYSPVYSPETGRVKIKLTETPKPKTPVVVTRSRSRAGEYINTPN